jgi:hypothetical protein
MMKVQGEPEYIMIVVQEDSEYNIIGIKNASE